MDIRAALLCIAAVSLLLVVGCTTEEATEPTDTPPAPPTLLSPSDGAENIANPPVLVWRGSAGATLFAVQVSMSESFTTLTFSDSSVTSTSREVPGLSNNSTYYWRVRASNGVGASGWSSPAWRFGTDISCPGTATVSHGGRTYTTVQIGMQCWLRENLDFGTMVPGDSNQTNNTVIEKYCYNDSIANCTAYGGLYRWDEAMQYRTMQGAQGICPPGWHLPSMADVVTLSEIVEHDGNALKANGQGSGGGAGSNRSGFAALLAGYRHIGLFVEMGRVGGFWSSMPFDATRASALTLGNMDSSVYIYFAPRNVGYSARCLKD